MTILFMQSVSFTMRNSLLAVALILVTVLVDPLTTTPSSSPTLTSSLNPTPSEYELHQLMESALYNNSYNMYKLSRAFFPVPFANAPVCVVVSYAITCSNSSSSPSCPNDFGDSDGSETYLSCDSGSYKGITAFSGWLRQRPPLSLHLCNLNIPGFPRACKLYTIVHLPFTHQLPVYLSSCCRSMM